MFLSVAVLLISMVYLFLLSSEFSSRIIKYLPPDMQNYHGVRVMAEHVIFDMAVPDEVRKLYFRTQYVGLGALVGLAGIFLSARNYAAAAMGILIVLVAVFFTVRKQFKQG